MDPSSVAPKNIPGMAAIDTEHQLQMGLVHAFEEAVRKDDLSAAWKILDQMAELADVHFLAEELLMRLTKYPRFDEHAQEHARLLEELGSVKRSWGAGSLAPTVALAEKLKRSLAEHLQGPDQALAAYLAREAAAADQSQSRI